MVSRGKKVRFTTEHDGAKLGEAGVVLDPGRDGWFTERFVTVQTKSGKVKVSRDDIVVEED